MAKYGKKFRKLQREEWKQKYFDYKKAKQLIKKFIKEKDLPKTGNEDNNNINNINDVNAVNAVDEFEKTNQNITDFTNLLDKEIKKVYVFFTNKEKKLYKDVNKYLHQKEDYPDFDLSEYLVHFNLLYELSKYNLNLSIFVYYNLKAVLKILKKFDKKVIGPKDKDNHILFNYIQTKLEEQNSDILYLFRLKMIDEVNVIMESLIRYLRDCLKTNKKKFKDEENQINEEDNKEQLMNKNLTYNELYNNIEQQYKKIQKNMKNIDLIAMSTVKLFSPWKEFLRISSDVSSRLMQMNKEFSFSEASLGEERKYSRSRSISITEGIAFSKENKKNIYITLFHGFYYYLSFSIIIPTYVEYINDFNVNEYYYGLLMMMAPLGTLIGYTYETCFFKRSTKIPFIASMLELIIGYIFYISAKKFNIFSLLFIGRFLVGLSNLRSHNKMYIINYLSRKDTNFYLTMFHGSSILGLFFGFFINIWFNRKPSESNNKLVNDRTLGALFIIFFSIIFLFVIIFLYSEGKSKKFHKLSVSTVNRNIEPPEQQQTASINAPEDKEQTQVDVQKDTIMIQNIDEQLNDFNKKSKFDDTNLVSRSIYEIAEQEKESLNTLKKSFWVYMFIIFTTKFINESMIIYFGLNILKVDENILNEYPWLHALVLALSYLMVILLELALSKKVEITQDKTFLMIILSLNLINISCLIFISQQNLKILITNTSLAIILSNMIQKTSSHYFFNIIPNHYILCGIQGNVLINIISTFGRITSCLLLFMYKIKENEIVNEYFDVFYYSIMTLFSLISLLLYMIFYSEIRVKAISRIIKSNNKKEVKIATDV